jgi:hypothetical protein
MGAIEASDTRWRTYYDACPAWVQEALSSREPYQMRTELYHVSEGKAGLSRKPAGQAPITA